MTLNDIIFVDNLPKLDLHGYDREIARVLINDFINDMYKQKIEIFTIVHGIGAGVLKNVTIETLKKNKKVAEFKLFYYNTGCMLVRINC